MYETGPIIAGLNKNYIVVNDITYDTPITTVPITGFFSGTFDGGGFTISDLTINDNFGSSLGFFQVLSGATVRNVVFENFVIGDLTSTSSRPDNSSSRGVLAGRVSVSSSPTLIENVIISGGAVHGNNDIGGLIGFVQSNIELLNVMNSATVSTVSTNQTGNNAAHIGLHAGGIIGRIEASIDSVTFSGIAQLGNISGRQFIGGLIGRASKVKNLIIENSYNAGNVTQTDSVRTTFIGGVIAFYSGWNNNAAHLSNLSIVNSLNFGKVIYVNRDESALIGTYQSFNDLDKALENVYAVTSSGSHSVFRDQTKGSIILEIMGGQFFGFKSETDLKDETLLSGLGFDFDTVWVIDPQYNNGFPTLQYLLPQE